VGAVLHGTRSGKAGNPPDAEYEGTINYCSNIANGASYNAVIHKDGTLCELVHPGNAAWHAAEMNSTWMGVAFCQAVDGEVISDAQYKSAAWYLRTYLKGMFGVPLTVGGTLFQHKETAQGKSYGKSDVGGGFEWSLLQQYL
jgi:hypothetical protein